MTTTDHDPAAEGAGDAGPAGVAGLAGRARRGVWAGVGAGIAAQALSVGATMVLARLLVPDDFGLIAAAALVTALLDSLAVTGVQASVVRLPSRDQRALSTLWWIALAVAILCSAACAALAEPVGRWQGDPRITDFVLVLGLLFVVRSPLSVLRPMMQRELRFGAVYAVDTASVAVLAAVQVGAALLGFGAWSFVLGQYAQAVVVVVAYAVLVRFRPSFAFDRAVAREQLTFGGHLWLTALLRYPNKTADNWVVSTTMGTAALGAYSVAYVLPNVLRQRITTATGEIMTPTYARLRDQAQLLRTAYGRSLRLHAAVGVPAMAGLGVLSPEVVQVFFGSAWAAAATPMLFICLASAADFLTMPGGSLLVSQGMGARLLRIQAGRLVVLAAGLAVVVLVPFTSLAAVAVAVAVAAFAGALQTVWSGARALGWSPWSLLGTLWLPWVAAGGMVAALLGVRQLIADLHPALVIAVCIPVGALVYVAVLLLLSRRAARDMLDDVLLLVPARWRRRKAAR